MAVVPMIGLLFGELAALSLFIWDNVLSKRSVTPFSSRNLFRASLRPNG
jgi:hypothetical protein